MKKLLPIALLSAFFLTGCSSDSASDEFENGNGQVAEKYILKLQIVPADSSEETTNLIVNYDSNNKLTSVGDGFESAELQYQNNNLTTITGDGDAHTLSELYEAPYKGYEVGKVLNYDAKGNPVNVSLYEEGNPGEEEFTAQITYDDAPNTFFYTLKAAGIIDVLDKVELNMNFQSVPEEIIKAKLLLPVNNQVKVVVKDAQGLVVSQVVTAYVYGTDKYPTKATVTETTEDGVYVQTIYYTYK